MLKRKFFYATLVTAHLIGIVVSPVAAQPAQGACGAGTWQDCGIAVSQALDKHPPDPKEIASLAMLWSNSFAKAYDAMRVRGSLTSSTPDSEKVFDAILSELDPIKIARDQVGDVLLKPLLARIPTMLKWGDAPLAWIDVTFDSSVIATDYDELKAENDIIQEKVAASLASSLIPDWKLKLIDAAARAAPSLRRP